MTAIVRCECCGSPDGVQPEDSRTCYPHEPGESGEGEATELRSVREQVAALLSGGVKS